MNQTAWQQAGSSAPPPLAALGAGSSWQQCLSQGVALARGVPVTEFEFLQIPSELFSLRSNSAACSSAVRKPAISLADSTDLRYAVGMGGHRGGPGFSGSFGRLRRALEGVPELSQL